MKPDSIHRSSLAFIASNAKMRDTSIKRSVRKRGKSDSESECEREEESGYVRVRSLRCRKTLMKCFKGGWILSNALST